MPDKSIGWRKKIHSKPKDIRSRHTPISRPSTPFPASTSSNAVDADDARSETSRPSTPGRPPTLARLVSSYRTLIDTPKESAGDFAEPWSDVAPPLDMLPIDPLLSMQSIYAHMNAISTRPIPVGYNSALFRIFEDYRKARASKNGLEKLLQQALEGMRIAEEAWVETEAQYQAEIRRLELLMVRGGVSSIAGLIRTRQDSVVKRKRTNRKTDMADRLQTSFEDVPMKELDEQIKSKSQKVLLQRPSSLSDKMAALSRQSLGTGSASDLHVGTPPSQDTGILLSRKAKSELDLANMERMTASYSILQTMELEDSQKGTSSTAAIESVPVILNPGIECDAFIALQELGTLVARKNGLNTNKFVGGLMQLLSIAEYPVEDGDTAHTAINLGDNANVDVIKDGVDIDPNLTATHSLRRSRSQPPLKSERRRRRHFSFEPGDDDMEKYDSELVSHRTRSSTSSDDVAATASSHQGSVTKQLEPQLSSDLQKPTKIPSPMQRPRLGSIRRDGLLPDMQQDNRRTSSSSVLTAIRKNSSGSATPGSRSKNTSAAAIAAARAARSSGMVTSVNGSPLERSSDHA